MPFSEGICPNLAQNDAEASNLHARGDKTLFTLSELGKLYGWYPASVISRVSLVNQVGERILIEYDTDIVEAGTI